MMQGTGRAFALLIALMAAACASGPEREGGLLVAAMVPVAASPDGPDARMPLRLRINHAGTEGTWAASDDALERKFDQAVRQSLSNAGYDLAPPSDDAPILDLTLKDLTIFDVTGRTTAVLVLSHVVHDGTRRFCSQREAVTTFISVATRKKGETAGALAGGVVAGVIVGAVTQSPEAGAAVAGSAVATNPGLYQRAPGVGHLSHHQEPGPMNRADRELHSSEGAIRHGIAQLLASIRNPECRPPQIAAEAADPAF